MHRIDWPTRSDIKYIERSDDSRAVTAPDIKRNLIGGDALNYFVLTVSPKLSNFYPYSYKFDKREHRSSVNQRVDRINHLVKNCNSEMEYHA